MHISKTTQSLFYSFPRKVGNPKQWTVNDDKSFEDFVVMNNGINDCFVSVYALPDHQTSAITIDKIYIDLDGIPQALDDAKMIFNYCQDNNIPVIPVASGKKGIHLYILIKPMSQRVSYVKKLLYMKTIGLLKQIFPKQIPETIDFHCIGVTSQITRIPDTQRPFPLRSYCAYLPDTFVNWNWHGLNNWTKEPDFNIDHSSIFSMKKLDMLTLPSADLPTNVRTSNQYLDKVESMVWDIKLKKILRPCLYRHITSSNPCHNARLAVSTDLLHFFQPKDIASMFQKLNWRDFDYDTTLYQIKSCLNYEVWSCSKLIEKKLPRKCCVD